MATTLEATKMPKAAPKKRNRRAPEDLVAALEAKIQAIKVRAVRKRAKSNPAVRYTVAAVRNMDKAMGAAEDQVLRKALEEARSGLAAYLALQGVMPAGGSNGAVRGRRSPSDLGEMGATLLAYVKSNPGQRGEQIAEAVGTDSKTVRRPMLQLIEDGRSGRRGSGGG